MHGYGRNIWLKIEAAHLVKILVFGGVVEIRQEFMVSPTHYVQTEDLSFFVTPCIESQLLGEQIARDKEDIVVADLLCVNFQM